MSREQALLTFLNRADGAMPAATLSPAMPLSAAMNGWCAAIAVPF